MLDIISEIQNKLVLRTLEPNVVQIEYNYVLLCHSKDYVVAILKAKKGQAEEMNAVNMHITCYLYNDMRHKF